MDSTLQQSLVTRLGPSMAGLSRASSSASTLRVGSPADPLEHEAEAAVRRPATEGSERPSNAPDFSHIRLHTDDTAAQSAQVLGAQAYTLGEHIVFGRGQFSPTRPEGHDLLAHEVVHTVQQGTMNAGLIQRQIPSATPSAAPAPPTPQQIYAQALARLQTLDPAIHGYLSRATSLNTTATWQTSTSLAPNSPPVTTIFNLQLQGASSLGPGVGGSFVPGSIGMTTGPGGAVTIPVDMTMQVNTSVGANDLADALLHEGTHMLVFIDKVPTTATQSPHTAGLATITATARANANYQPLLTELAAVQPAGGNAAQQAQEIVDHILEEKYVYNRVDRVLARTTPTVSNTRMAREYITRDLATNGVTLSVGDPKLTSMINRAQQILDDIDARQRAATTPPTGSAAPPTGSTPPPPGSGSGTPAPPPSGSGAAPKPAPPPTPKP